jgi:predicted alpha/beta superfamily hydrolase
MYRLALGLIAFASVGVAVASAMPGDESRHAEPLSIGQTFEIRSAILGETRRINVYYPAGFPTADAQPLPVLYMPDGGMNEDFLHIAGLIEVSVGNNTMRPWLLVGIENTERRRDLTGPTDNADDRKIAKHVGASQCFREFIRTELMPEIRARYRTTPESGIVGESLAGLFVMETFVLEPDLFDRYVAIDPSLWWNRRQLVRDAGPRLTGHAFDGKSLFVASSVDADVTDFAQLVDAKRAAGALPGLEFRVRPFADETHATIYHPAALAAFRAVFSTPPAPGSQNSRSSSAVAAPVHLVGGACERLPSR